MLRFATFIVFILAATTVRGATIHVPSEQPTIQAGIDVASDSDTVLVAAGVYLEDIEWDDTPVNLVSVSGRHRSDHSGKRGDY